AAGEGKYTVTLRFDDVEAAQHWLASQQRRTLLAEAGPLLARGEEVRTVAGLEFWVSVPSPAQRRAPPSKQFLVALSVIYPLTLFVPWLLHPVLQWFAGAHLQLVGHLLNVGTVVFLMTYVVMPPYTRLVSRWLYR